MHRTLFASLTALSLLACGGSSTRSQTADRADDAEDEDAIVDEASYEAHEGDDEEEATGGGFVDSAMLRGSGSVPPLTLGEPVPVPGTGVTVRPPEGARPMPFGAGFIAPRQRVQVSVVVAEGDEDLLESIRTGGNPDAPPPEHVEEITIDGVDARVGRDRVRTPGGVLERLWLLAHDGTRGMGVVATYEANRADAYRVPLRESLADVAWDRDATLDAAAALGIDVGPVEGLEASHRSTANLVLLEPESDFPPEPEQVVVTVSPLPMQIPPDQIERACQSIVARLVPVPASAVSHEGSVEDGEMTGCERLATAETREGLQVATYAALLFARGMPVLMTASVDAEQLETWRERFASAARSVRLRPQQ
ncbi:MAG TPA: hypothetical protein RMH99_00515 [Sandaracinaceae bacterium LLY-WYZ-13_1]|nr:hypothetical protein [Sandaracinaceae bacterium LLY-WYZ-13_1]